MNIHFLTFATSDWRKSRPRLCAQLAEIQLFHRLFSTARFLDEHGVPAEWRHDIEGKITVRDGFFLWSWKPYIVETALAGLQDGEFLLYMDGGCSLFDCHSFTTSAAALRGKCQGLTGRRFVALNHIDPAKCPIAVQVRRELLEAAGLAGDEDFLYRFPHYQSGVVLLRKCRETAELVSAWKRMYGELHRAVDFPRRDKHGQAPCFRTNNVDQAFLQILLYRRGVDVLDFQEFKKYTKRIRR